jgi:hypothetical protein
MSVGVPTLLELCCLAILGLWLWQRQRAEPDPTKKRQRLWQMAVVVPASLLGENTCIHLYGFYAYSREVWSSFVGEVPLLVGCIWPVVIVSAFDLTRSLLPHSTAGHRAVVVGGLVLTDAALIEPIAVDAGLWWWTQPGLFSVPPVGIWGWAFFAVGVALFLERPTRWLPWLLLGAPLLTHALLLAAWWGLFRWVNIPLPPWPFVALAWAVGLLCARGALQLDGPRLTALVPHVWRRGPAAAFFFVLLGIHARPGADADDLALLCYAVGFSLPWLTVMARARARGRVTG